MHLAKRVAVATAVLLISTGLAACKKEDKKEAPAAKVDDKGSGAASGSAEAEKKEEAQAAVKGFKGAMADISKEAGGGGMGGLGGMGSKLGGLFGGGGGAAAASAPAAKADTPQDPDRHAAGSGQDPSAVAIADGEGDQPPPEDPMAGVKFPPPGTPGGDCTAVVDRLMVIFEQIFERQIAGMPADVRAQMDQEIAAQKDSIKAEVLQECTDNKWSQELKDCALAAMSEADFEACERFEAEDARAEAAAKPLPAWTGGDDCAAVGERMTQLATAQMGELPPEYAAELEAELKEQAAVMTEMCTEGQWSADVRKCILAAATVDATDQCFTSM